MQNTRKYIGIPYVDNGTTLDGCDCWGLVMCFYEGEYNIKLQDYSSLYPNTKALDILGGIVSVEKEDKNVWERVEEPKAGDVVVISIRGIPVHCGIMVDNKLMLHNFFGTNSCVESVFSNKWNKRVEGFYRYVRK